MQVQLGSCGHPGPAVVRADGRVEILEGDGLPLGLFPDAEPGRLELELHEGDVLFFYTDGVTEAQERRPAASSRTGWRTRSPRSPGRSAAEIVRAVQELVTSFSAGELKDDVTILAVRVG